MRFQADTKITFDTKSILVDGKRWFPVMGEMHYSRVPKAEWAEELAKMKAGGVDILSAYTIWIHHEEKEDDFDFTGSKDLRRFMEEVKKSGLVMILRIGPWAHGEARNGGFPDWLLARAAEEGFEVRSDDPAYLAYVRKFYEKIYDQVKGYFLKDNGPIIGIQIENEYGHVGGFTGEKGEQHMRTLKAMAQEIGFDAPVYTATGWGGAVTGGMLPVMGGYCESPWDPRTTEIEPSVNYVFTEERNDHNIASDYGIGEGITFDMTKFPYLTAELGGGLQVTSHRRPVASGLDTEAMTYAKLGSGISLVGYYMYHGGVNPDGKLTTLQESTDSGYPNDLPVRNYDFNAPLKSYGQITDSYRRIRRLSLFLKDFGQDLADMDYVPQPGNPDHPEDLTSLRTAVRSHEIVFNGKTYESGYYFLNNYQRRQVMADHLHADLKAYGADSAVVEQPRQILADFGKDCGPANIKDGDHFMWPFNLPIGDKALLVSANVSPLCILHGASAQGKDIYVFYKSLEEVLPKYNLKGSLDGNQILTITASEALKASKLTLDGKDYLFFSDGDLIRQPDGSHQLIVQAGSKQAEDLDAKAGSVIATDEALRPAFCIFPNLPVKVREDLAAREDGFIQRAEFAQESDRDDLDFYNNGHIHVYAAKQTVDNPVKVSYELADSQESSEEQANVPAAEAGRAHALVAGNPKSIHPEDRVSELAEVGAVYVVSVTDADQPHHILLKVHYEGNKACMYQEEHLLDDSFYTGQTWEIGLDRYTWDEKSMKLTLAIEPLYEDQPVFLEKWPAMEDGKACRITEIEAISEYIIDLF